MSTCELSSLSPPSDYHQSKRRIRVSLEDPECLKRNYLVSVHDFDIFPRSPTEDPWQRCQTEDLHSDHSRAHLDFITTGYSVHYHVAIIMQSEIQTTSQTLCFTLPHMLSETPAPLRPLSDLCIVINASHLRLKKVLYGFNNTSLNVDRYSSLCPQAHIPKSYTQKLSVTQSFAVSYSLQENNFRAAPSESK